MNNIQRWLSILFDVLKFCSNLFCFFSLFDCCFFFNWSVGHHTVLHVAKPYHLQGKVFLPLSSQGYY